jgi:hypothetical protein
MAGEWSEGSTRSPSGTKSRIKDCDFEVARREKSEHENEHKQRKANYQGGGEVMVESGLIIIRALARSSSYLLH